MKASDFKVTFTLVGAQQSLSQPLDPLAYWTSQDRIFQNIFRRLGPRIAGLGRRVNSLGHEKRDSARDSVLGFSVYVLSMLTLLLLGHGRIFCTPMFASM